MYTLICTSYTETEQGLVLRNNWTEICDNLRFEELKEKQNLIPTEGKLSDYFNSDIFKVSNILTGRMELDNVVIHCRIVQP